MTKVTLFKLYKHTWCFGKLNESVCLTHPTWCLVYQRHSEFLVSSPLSETQGWELLLFHILFLSGSSFLWAVRAAKSDISSHMPLGRSRNTVFLQLLGPLNAEWEPLPGLSVQRLTVSISGQSDPPKSLELLDNTKREMSAPWLTLMAGAATPSGLCLGPHANTACQRLKPLWWNRILSSIGGFIGLI